MLIKLPSNIIGASELSFLLKELKANQFNSIYCKSFFELNPRISQEPEAIKMVVNYLDKVLSKPTEMEVKLAQTPDSDFVLELTDWVRTNIKESILLTVKVDPMLTGGIIIRSPHRIYDFSWANILNGRRELLNKMVNHAS